MLSAAGSVSHSLRKSGTPLAGCAKRVPATATSIPTSFPMERMTTKMSAEKGYIVEPMSYRNGPEVWIQHHRDQGHEPYAAPTDENPEKWECKCDPDAPGVSVWRTLTVEQTRIKHERMYGGEARRKRIENDPAWQERIRQAKQRVAEWEQTKK